MDLPPSERPAMPESGPLAFRARTVLLEQLRDLHRQEQQQKKRRGQLRPSNNGPQTGTESNNDDDSDDESDNSAPMAVRFVRGCPPLTDPSWAMEELLRIDPNVALWTGTGLSTAVWAPPGSGHCPFGTTQADFIRHR
ncbi:CRK9-associated protein [Trypanosoma cruzi]|uniref:CRK9-associated protein n=2 Tax=Trypanosoma cruzi TaxID=5693 RepID=Q4DP14_TRYCC|nr:hypothetical protein, conserved [Trypanosoma cruzi]EAN94266.1 hypothetical protein, conserved [Trypanosoma cruzi]KAF8293487.1 CRK9-associated protein [Trypanosoma cruzi]PWV18553.1 CRK9-associated protein [Trypanosoma cruzi]RNC55590.1 hypothetical protein TcCL_ESM06905 [Trypanosoma cruzi]|eukprot:XP_816117.1 hypothetical protein [Trypanosoma cruzi strain CL Brener]